MNRIVSTLLVIVLGTSIAANACMGQMVIGHRGASHDAPENTLAAFKLAFEQGADGIEGDFHLTSDNRIVCIHDVDTERVASRNLNVASSTLSEIQQLDVGSWKHERWHEQRPPSIEQVLEVIPEGKKFFIELKVGPKIVPHLKTVLDNSTFPGHDCVIISFKQATIQKCRELLPEIETHWLSGYKESEDDISSLTPNAETVIATLRTSGSDGFGSNGKREWFDARFIKRLKDAGFPTFHVWTIDDVETARFYQQNGASGITTNRPGFLIQQLESEN